MAILLLIVSMIALTWGAIVFLRGGLLGGCLVVLLTGIVLGPYFYRVSLGPMPVTLDRILWGLLIVQTVLWRRWGVADPKPLGRAEIVLGLFIAVLALSTFTHDWRVHNNEPMARLLFFYLMPLGIYWVARQTPLSERGMTWLLGCFALLGFYLAVTAVAETRQAWWLVYPKYIGSSEYPEFLGRGRGPLLNPAGNGILMGLGWVCTLWFAWTRTRGPVRLLLLASSLVLVAGIYSTMTRCAWIGAGLGLLTLLGLTLPRSWRAPVLIGSVLVVGLVAATQWEQLLAFKRDKGAGAEETAESVRLRPILARVAWNMFLDRPVLGCGFGQYTDESVGYLHDRSTDMVLEKARRFCQHNVFLSLLTETGLLGMGLFITLLFLWTRDAWHLWRSPTAPLWMRQQGLLMLVFLGNYLANGMFHDVSLIPVVNMLLFFLAGLTRGLVACADRDAAGTGDHWARRIGFVAQQDVTSQPAAGAPAVTERPTAERLGGFSLSSRSIVQVVSERPLTMTTQLQTSVFTRIELLGIPVDNVTLPEAVATILARLDEAQPQQVCFVNADYVNIACGNPAYREVLCKADLVFADGVGMRLAGKALGSPLRDNVNGTDLFPLLVKALSGSGKSVYLLGARPGVAEDVCFWIASRYPEVRIAGCHHGYFSADEEPDVIQAIRESGADLLLVAFGAPRQDLWIERHLETLGVRVAIGVGGLFDFYAGRIPRAPRWMRRMGLEWLYRLYQEPERLWRRYILGNPRFLWRVVRAMRTRGTNAAARPAVP